MASKSAKTPKPRLLLMAGFVALLAAGTGFAIRGAIYADWAQTFHFTGRQTGLMAGGGFSGFCLGIIIGGLVADNLGYGKLVMAAFSFHVLSALVAFATGDGMAPGTALALIWSSAFLFALANGVLESVVNPLVAGLFPNNRTHYLNLLHAAWPAGLIIGFCVHDYLAGESWKLQLGCFLIPVVIYGVLFLALKIPRSEASLSRLRLRERLRDVGLLGAAVVGLFVFLFFKDGLGSLLAGFAGHEQFFKGGVWFYISAGMGGTFMLLFAGTARWTLGAPLLVTLFITQALAGVVDPDMENWIQNFEDRILLTGEGTKLFLYIFSLTVVLRCCGNFFQRKFKFTPIGLLLVCSVLTAAGLNLISLVNDFWFALVALTIYAFGEAFLWPTMLAVASDRFPRCGASAISLMGGLAMMSAWLIGAPGLGYAEDRFSGEALAQMNPGVYADARAATQNQWLWFKAVNGIDGEKLLAATSVVTGMRNPSQQIISEANTQANRKTLRLSSLVPLTLAGIFALLLVYFKFKGGYGIVPMTGGGGVGRRESIR
jgi:MFS family permease